jgi:anti-sigma B factor antagonist
MNLTTTLRGDDLVIAVHEDRIDAAVAVQFKDAVRTAAEPARARVVLDLSQVRFLDSSGLGALVASMKALGPDRRLDLLAPTPPVQKVLRLTRMDSVFAIFPNEESAFGSGSLVRAG